MNTWTINKLIQSSARLKSWRGNWANYRDLGTLVGEIKFTPFLGTKSLLIVAEYIGVSQAPRHHKVNLFFEQVEILEELPNNDRSYLREYFAVDYNGKIYYIKKLSASRNPIRVRCSCFTGDTKVLLADGTSKPIKELVGKSFEVFAYNEITKRFEIAQAYNCEKKKDNAELLKITLDNGHIIKCTPDHRFLLKNGNWLKADELFEGASLQALYYCAGKDLALNETITAHVDNDKFYVYIYLDPTKAGNYEYTTCSFDYEPIYVGKGCGNRLYHHLYAAHSDKDYTHFINRLRKIIKSGYEPIILKYACNLMENKAFELEKQLTEEIGLRNENKGTLLNSRLGGKGGISQPILEKCIQTNIERGNYTRTAKRMHDNNPMYNSKTVNKVIQTQRNLGLYDSERMKNIANYRTAETFKKSFKTRIENNPGILKNFIDGGAAWRHEQILNGTYHTQTEQFKNHMRERGFKYGSALAQKRIEKERKNPELLKARIEKINKTKTLKRMIDVIKNYGKFIPEKYNPNGTGLRISTLKQKGLYEQYVSEATQQAFYNHKVVSIERIENDDVYCLTVKGLMNFVIDTSKDNEVTSGVVVANCADFVYRWGWYDYYNANCMYGPAPRPYKKVAGSNRQSVNPNKIPGICKHVLGTVKALESKGVIKY